MFKMYSGPTKVSKEIRQSLFLLLGIAEEKKINKRIYDSSIRCVWEDTVSKISTRPEFQSSLNFLK